MHDMTTKMGYELMIKRAYYFKILFLREIGHLMDILARPLCGYFYIFMYY